MTPCSCKISTTKCWLWSLKMPVVLSKCIIAFKRQNMHCHMFRAVVLANTALQREQNRSLEGIYTVNNNLLQKSLLWGLFGYFLSLQSAQYLGWHSSSVTTLQSWVDVFVFDANSPGICRNLALCFEPSDLPLLWQGLFARGWCHQGEWWCEHIVLLLPFPQQTMGAGAPWVPGCRMAGRDLLIESGNPHRNIEGHSNVRIFSRNRPCNLHEGMKSCKDGTWLPARSPSPLVMSSKTHLLPVQLVAWLFPALVLNLNPVHQVL